MTKTQILCDICKRPYMEEDEQKIIGQAFTKCICPDCLEDLSEE